MVCGQSLTLLSAAFVVLGRTASALQLQQQQQEQQQPREDGAPQGAGHAEELAALVGTSNGGGGEGIRVPRSRTSEPPTAASMSRRGRNMATASRRDSSPRQFHAAARGANAERRSRWQHKRQLRKRRTPNKSEEVSLQTPLPVAEGYYRKVSTTLKCVMCLTALSVWMYLCLAIARNVDELAGLTMPSVATDMLSAAARSIYYPPMLACLFVACRLHVLANTAGLGEPQPWVKRAMYACTGGMLSQYCIVVCLSLLSRPRKTITFSQQIGNALDVHPRIGNTDFRFEFLKPVFLCLQFVTMVSIYSGVIVIIYGMFTYQDGSTHTEEPSPSLKATVVLTLIYLGNRILIWVGEARVEFRAKLRRLKTFMGRSVEQDGSAAAARDQAESNSWEHAALAFAFSVQKAPMLALLFMSARLRAMECDPWNGKPQWWARQAFGYTTIAMLAEGLVASLIGFFGTEEVGYYNMHIFKCQNRIGHLVLQLLNAVTGFNIWTVVISIWTIAPPPPEPPKRFPPSLKCILTLATMYLSVQGMFYFVLFCKHVLNTKLPLLQNITIAAHSSVNFSPVLGVLFLAARMRAVQVTNFQGSPQTWAQDAMYLAVFAVILQAICTVALPMLSGNRSGFDEEGNASYDLGPTMGAYVVTSLKYFVLVSLVGSTATICYSVFDISPDTANYGGQDQFFHSIKDIAGVVAIILFAMFLSSAKVVGHAVKTVIESVPSSAIGGCSVTIEKAVLSVFHGYVNLVHVKVGNPELPDSQTQFRSPYFVEVHNVVVQMSPLQMITSRFKLIEIQYIALKGVHVNIEKAGLVSESNISVLKRALKGNKQKEEEEEEIGTKEEKKEKHTNIVLHALDVRDVCANFVKGSGKPFARFTLADICLGNLANEKLTASDVVALILSTLVKTAMSNTDILKSSLHGCLPCTPRSNKDALHEGEFPPATTATSSAQ